jgi:alkanesulfonate monooxygenase SsuD/methylene tetrahydromethanopterin reductase-like flavin-dependent oxidoreductase (luciferase family)
MKLGFAIPIVGPAVTSAVGLSAFCRGLEDLGYDTLWVGDRLVTPVDMHSTYAGTEQPYPPQMKRYLDPVLLWTVAAAATSRVRLNASTLSTFYYEPVHLARLLTTLDVLSDGRLDVGVGVGWMKDEHDIARSANWRRRGQMLDDVLAFLHEWWTTNPVSWDSEFFSLPAVHADLRPVQVGGPPIWIGGASEAAMRRVGRSGVGWLAVEGPAFFSQVREVVEQDRLDDTFVDALCEPAEVFTYGGMIAHVLTFAAHRRTLVALSLAKHGVDELGWGDPMVWVATPAAG